MTRVLFDVNVVLDVLAERGTFVEEWNDFEHAVQASCAEHVEAAFLVTRNKRDFRGAATRVVTPGELIALIGTTR